MRTLLTLAVAALDVWAILAVLDSRLPRRSKLFWILLIVALPVVGVFFWRRARPEPPAPVRA